MIITFPNGAVLDTSGIAGFLTFNTATGVIEISGSTVYTPPSAMLFARLQAAITTGLRNGSPSLSFSPDAPPVITSASPNTFLYNDQPIIVLTGYGFQPGITGGIDYAGVNGSALPYVPVSVTYVSPSTVYFTCPGLGAGGNSLLVTLTNPDGGSAVYTVGTISTTLSFSGISPNPFPTGADYGSLSGSGFLASGINEGKLDDGAGHVYAFGSIAITSDTNINFYVATFHAATYTVYYSTNNGSTYVTTGLTVVSS